LFLIADLNLLSALFLVLCSKYGVTKNKYKAPNSIYKTFTPGTF